MDDTTTVVPLVPARHWVICIGEKVAIRTRRRTLHLSNLSGLMLAGSSPVRAMQQAGPALEDRAPVSRHPTQRCRSVPLLENRCLGAGM